MKLVIGIVRPEKANDVLESLYRAEVRGVSMSRVQGHGGELERVETYRGTTVKMGLAEKVRLEIAVSDEFVDATVEALCEGARTGDRAVGSRGADSGCATHGTQGGAMEKRRAAVGIVERGEVGRGGPRLWRRRRRGGHAGPEVRPSGVVAQVEVEDRTILHSGLPAA